MTNGFCDKRVLSIIDALLNSISTVVREAHLTMGKRHSSADGEEEYEENAASKRPRIDEEDDDNDDEEEEEEEEDNLNTERIRRTIVESSSRKGVSSKQWITNYK